MPNGQINKHLCEFSENDATQKTNNLKNRTTNINNHGGVQIKFLNLKATKEGFIFKISLTD